MHEQDQNRSDAFAAMLAALSPTYDRHGLSAAAFAIDLASHVVAKERALVAGDRGEKDRVYAKLHSALRDLFFIARDQLSEPTRVEDIGGLRWHAYTGGPRAGYIGYVERCGEGVPEGPARVVYWLAADGQVQRPAADGSPPGGQAPPAGGEVDHLPV